MGGKPHFAQRPLLGQHKLRVEHGCLRVLTRTALLFLKQNFFVRAKSCVILVDSLSWKYFAVLLTASWYQALYLVTR